MIWQPNHWSKVRNNYTLQWHHNGRNGVLNHRRLDCLLKRLFKRRSKKTSMLRVTGLCEGNSPMTDECPAQRASNTENVSIWWRYHDICVAQHQIENMTNVIRWLSADRHSVHHGISRDPTSYFKLTHIKWIVFNTLRLRQNFCNFTDDIFKLIFMYGNCCV